jgi:hypothetical protein
MSDGWANVAVDLVDLDEAAFFGDMVGSGGVNGEQ